MNALLAYQFEEAPVRVVMIAGDPWFVANDVATVLGYRDAHNMARNLDDDEKGTHIVSTLGGDQSLAIISESGLYAAIFKSRRAEAIRFRRWVTGEVLPSIRRSGRYELRSAEPPLPTPLDHDPSRLQASVAVVREARRLFGPIGARNIWLQLGLPQPIADADGSQQGDPWAEAVKDWLASRVETSVVELARGINVAPIDFSARMRLRALLQLFGWREHVLRRDGAPTRRWLAPQPQGADHGA